MYKRYLQLLKENKKTNKDVSKGTGISASTLSEWKHGKHDLSRKNIERIANFFGVSVDFLLYGELTIPRTNMELFISPPSKEETLRPRDERDIALDLENIKRKLQNGEEGVASFEGVDIPPEDQELFLGQVELMLRRLKAINKVKYNPHKNGN